MLKCGGFPHVFGGFGQSWRRNSDPIVIGISFTIVVGVTIERGKEANSSLKTEDLRSLASGIYMFIMSLWTITQEWVELTESLKGFGMRIGDYYSESKGMIKSVNAGFIAKLNCRPNEAIRDQTGKSMVYIINPLLDDANKHLHVRNAMALICQ
ncbi:hypothetical protein BBP40_007026 [Aspergillus hancockii]|nr:hypothetical protein BBP40_007026 [Aspergillus hancockii]